MKEEILDIAKKLYHNHLTVETGTNLLLGLFSVVGQSEQYTCDCKVCGKPFGDKLSLYEHYDEEHN
tara:strand:+ start:1285 stop:1482 length:198 start_codon:yes stop_codon:yes gene_type:complete